MFIYMCMYIWCMIINNNNNRSILLHSTRLLLMIRNHYSFNWIYISNVECSVNSDYWKRNQIVRQWNYEVRNLTASEVPESGQKADHLESLNQNQNTRMECSERYKSVKYVIWCESSAANGRHACRHTRLPEQWLIDDCTLLYGLHVQIEYFYISML